MIVDDEPENLNVLEASLSHAGYRVSVFPRGDLALAAAQAEQPDLALLDIQMPGLDGYEVCRRFKADERLRSIPVLFISARTTPEDVTTGFECGGVDYITKPFRESEVMARVRTHIALRRAYATLTEQHARLEALERHRDTLVHMLVHDMRTPLQVILGHLHMIEEFGASNLKADTLGDLRAAVHGTQCVSRMVTTVIDLSRMETQDIPLHRIAVPPHTLFHAACAQTVNPSSSRPITERIAEPCPPLLCDVDVSTRIVSNLLANALKYSPSNSEVVLVAEPHPNGVRIAVRDHGAGIPAAYHQRIFDKFGVADQPANARVSSTGLGLAFCRLAVKAQGGTIGLESEPGKGSTFWFTLPAAAPA
jgi:K+-sensing histidine kinase KdpD